MLLPAVVLDDQIIALLRQSAVKEFQRCLQYEQRPVQWLCELGRRYIQRQHAALALGDAQGLR